MPNLLAFADWVTLESLRILLNKLVIAETFNTDYNKEFQQDFAIGDTVRVKLPQRYLVRDGLGYNPQAINRQTTPVTCNQIFGIDFEWDSVQKALEWERGGEEVIRREYVEPLMAQLANEIDSRASLWAYQNTNNIVGALGTNPTSLDPFQQARQRMIEKACPFGGERKMIIPPAVNTSLIPAFVGYFNPSSEISRQYKEGSMGTASGYEWFESVNLYKHTAGTWQTPASVTVHGAGQSGSSLTINATAGDTFMVGDVFSIANVNPVNPMNRRVQGSSAQQFVVTQALTAAGSGVDVLQISPAIIPPPSQYQNVDATPADTALLSLFPGTTTPNGKSGMQGIAIHRDAFAMVSVPLEVPKAVEMASRTRDPKTGITIRFVRSWNQVESKMTNRADVVLGFGNLYPDNCAVRIECA